jgi:hypothetical protein
MRAAMRPSVHLLGLRGNPILGSAAVGGRRYQKVSACETTGFDVMNQLPAI